MEDSCLITTDFTDAIFTGTSFENATAGFTKFNGVGLGLIRDLQKAQYAEVPANAQAEIRAAFPPRQDTLQHRHGDY